MYTSKDVADRDLWMCLGGVVQKKVYQIDGMHQKFQSRRFLPIKISICV